MSFITKRERVFNDYDILYNLPSRNEGKLKAYASCTDARAWSHFCSDKSEHLADIIRKNNDTCPVKYVPTDVIVNTLMITKNVEIARLKRKIEELEQLLEAFDQLDLTPAQKCEIANAHEAIRAANRELEDMGLDLDLSGFTEARMVNQHGIDSDAFETGKSRGEEPGYSKMIETGKSRGYEASNECDCNIKHTARSKDFETPRSKSSERRGERKQLPMRQKHRCNQTEKTLTCDTSTTANDPRIQEMKDTIITKDAKLSAMKNTIAVMENDVCEPYCIYAHIFTALEKIFGILCQNDKYKSYLETLVANKDTRNIDIKAKILFKLKILEKFAVALMAPCYQGTSFEECPCKSKNADKKQKNAGCSCYRVETSMSIKPAETKQATIDDKRAKLVADIMENEEMKEILSKDSTQEEQPEDTFNFESYNIDTENLNRLKNLQATYDDLMTCYEELKHEKECLQIRCQKYEELEKEAENLRSQLREYNLLWAEKEHYRKRSADLDSLKEQYLLLTDEASNLETQLNAEFEINKIKANTIDDLRNSNITIEKKLNEAVITFEKEKNALQCKLMETECKVMCQEQQIKSLSIQMDKLLEQDNLNQVDEDIQHPLKLMNEIETLKEQIINLKESLISSEEEKSQLQKEFQDNLNTINSLKTEIEDWKGTYEKSYLQVECLQNYVDNLLSEIDKLKNENNILSNDVQEKGTAMENLIRVISHKSQEINKLLLETDLQANENRELSNRLYTIKDTYENNIDKLQNEKSTAISKLQIVRQESEEILGKVGNNPSSDFHTGCSTIVTNIADTVDGDKKTQKECDILLKEIETIHKVSLFAAKSISSLNEEKCQYRKSLELIKKESDDLKEKLLNFEGLSQQMRSLHDSHEKLLLEKSQLKTELQKKTEELEDKISLFEVTKKKSEELMDKIRQSETLKEDLITLNDEYKKLVSEKQILQKELADKNKDINELIQSLKDIQTKNAELQQNSERLPILENELKEFKTHYNDLLIEKRILKTDYENKTEEINNFYNVLESKIEENRNLLEKIRILQDHQQSVRNDFETLKHDTKEALESSRKESVMLIDKIKQYESLEEDHIKLKEVHDNIVTENNKLQEELNNVQKENQDLLHHCQQLSAHAEDLERSLSHTRKELISHSVSPQFSYADITAEISKLTEEKLLNQKKIRNLLDELEEAGEVISNLNQDVKDRDNKIAILDNYNNELAEEVRRLQSILSSAIEAGVQIRENSLKKIDESLHIMEAHHSKATHNMKAEIAVLQNKNVRLGEKLSVTKLETERSIKDKQNYAKQITDLQNEKEIIVSDIKHLEAITVGDSTLVPETSDINDILLSLDRIRKSLKSRSSKTTSLEQTLLKVETSSQLLLSKADEAKKIVEKEKQKIITEKEEAIKERLHMENQLIELKEKLEEQITNDKNVIKDLEAEILNHKLCLDKINQSTQDYISKLKEEMQSLQLLYQHSKEQILVLENNLNDVSEENNKNVCIIKKIKSDIEEKCREIGLLHQTLEKIKNKVCCHVEIQTDILNCNAVKITQTEDSVILLNNQIGNEEVDIANSKNHITAPGIFTDSKSTQDNLPPHSVISVPSAHLCKEVQTIAVNNKPNLELVRIAYMNHKIKKLSLGKIEQYCISDTMTTNLEDSFVQKNNLRLENKAEGKSSVVNLIDIYHHRGQPKSSKITDKQIISDSLETFETSHDRGSQTNVNTLIKDRFDYDPNSGDSRNAVMLSTSDKEPSEDVFLIYKDSENKNNEIEMKNYHTQSLATQSNLFNTQYDRYPIQRNKSIPNDIPGNESIKRKLNINMPIVSMESTSLATTSDGDQKCGDNNKSRHYSNPQQNITFLDVKIGKQPDKKYAKKDFQSLPTVINYNKSTNSKPNDVYLLPFNGSKANDVSEAIDVQQIQKINIPVVQQKQLGNKEFNESTGTSPYDIIRCDSHEFEDKESNHKLSRVGADVLLIKKDSKDLSHNKDATKRRPYNFGFEYILNSVQQEIDPETLNVFRTTERLRKCQSDQKCSHISYYKLELLPPKISSSKITTDSDYSYQQDTGRYKKKSLVERSVMAKDDNYETKIETLKKALEYMEKDYKKKIDAIKNQYDTNIKNIINEHNQGVQSLQNLHEETLQDIIKIHENEVENLRTMSIEAMRKVNKLDKENKTLKCKIRDSFSGLHDIPTKITNQEVKRRKSKICGDSKFLSKTDVEAFNVNPKPRSHGPCTCSLDINISDTIRNILEQVDVEQRKVAEQTFLKSIANKILSSSVESLDPQELAFLHLKVCRTWKVKLSKKDAIKKRIDLLENEMLNKQRNAQQHIAELDRKVAEERRRLEEVREAVCRDSPASSRSASPALCVPGPIAVASVAEKDFGYACNSKMCNIDLKGLQSSGDLSPEQVPVGPRHKRTKPQNKSFHTKVGEERREQRFCSDERPTRLRKTQDRKVNKK